MALHKAIWQQAGNPHLLRVLDGHRRLVDQINAGDAEAAVRTIQAQRD